MTPWETGSMLRSNKVNLINFNMNLFFICQVQINNNSNKNILTSSWIKSTQLCTGHVTSRLTSKVALSHDSYLTHHMIVFSRGKKRLTWSSTCRLWWTKRCSLRLSFGIWIIKIFTSIWWLNDWFVFKKIYFFLFLSSGLPEKENRRKNYRGGRLDSANYSPEGTVTSSSEATLWQFFALNVQRFSASFFLKSLPIF